MKIRYWISLSIIMPNRRSPLLQKTLFLRRTLASEQPIAMGETSKSADDVPMPFGMGEPGLPQSSIEQDRKVLVDEVLGMGKGQAEEQPQVSIDRLHIPRCLRQAGDMSGQGVRCVHVRGATKGVARKLVEQDQQRQRALGGIQPSVAFTANHRPMQVEKTLAKASVERWVLGEPLIGARLPPEPDDGSCLRVDDRGHDHRSLATALPRIMDLPA